MKTLLWVLGAGLLLFNGALAFLPFAGAMVPAQIFSALAGLGVLIATASLKKSAPPAVPIATTAAAPAPPPTPVRHAPAPVPAVAPLAVPAPAARAEAEIVGFLALLQEKGRLVDFVREDIVGATDDQVGAAARVVHAGCRQVLNDYFEIAPVRTEAEGTRVTLPVGYDAAAHRLLGSVAAHPPYTGKLAHPGWAVHTIKLPRVTGLTADRAWPVLAPAEVEVGGA